MLILGCDMSGNENTLAIAKDNDVLAEMSITVKMKHLQEILPSIDFLLKTIQKKINDIDLFIVITGPGSWTGIRIAVTMIKSMALSLNKPVVGVCSLDVLAYNYRFTDIPVYPIIDAARQQVYYSEYNCKGSFPISISDYYLIKLDKLLDKLVEKIIIVGDGVNKYRKKIISSSNKNIIISPENLNKITGSNIIESGLYKYHNNGASDTFKLVPNYMQESDAERKFFSK